MKIASLLYVVTGSIAIIINLGFIDLASDYNQIKTMIKSLARDEIKET